MKLPKTNDDSPYGEWINQQPQAWLKYIASSNTTKGACLTIGEISEYSFVGGFEQAKKLMLAKIKGKVEDSLEDLEEHKLEDECDGEDHHCDSCNTINGKVESLKWLEKEL